MTAHFFDLAFTPSVRAAQEANGSRRAYARHHKDTDEPDRLSEEAAAFIAERDSFYMATVSETGWPYLQHRGGPKGFIKVLNDRTLGLADFRGNRQYVSLGNLNHDDRAALFFMDYPRQTRLKLLARVRTLDLASETKLAAALVDADYEAKVERGLLIRVEAFDWNCPQHITPRFTETEVRSVIAKQEVRIAELEAEVAALKVRGG